MIMYLFKNVPSFGVYISMLLSILPQFCYITLKILLCRFLIIVSKLQQIVAIVTSFIPLLYLFTVIYMKACCKL